MKSKTIVFDLDDTLVHEIDYLKSAFIEIAQKVDVNNKGLFKEMLQWYENKENVYRRSPKANYYVYDIASKKQCN